MFKLVIQDDEGKTTVVPLIRDEITIGRKEGNTIRLTERNVSRRHARIVRNNGEVQIEDLGSYNGIRVNNARIAERVSLRVSDQVQIGDYKLYLKAEGVEQVDDARTMPIERVDSPLATEVMPAVSAGANGATAPAPGAIAATPSPAAARAGAGGVVSSISGTADTDPGGRPVATPAQVAALTQTAAYGKLVVVSSNFAGKEFDLTRPQMIIGRTDENDIVINHRSISRNHAKVTRDPDSSRYTISDLQSSNGVRVNGQDYGKVELRRGDTVDLGHVRLRFVEPGEDFVFDRDAVISEVAEPGGKKGLMIAVVLGVLVLVGVGAFFFLKSSGDDNKKPNTGGIASGSDTHIASGDTGQPGPTPGRGDETPADAAEVATNPGSGGSATVPPTNPGTQSDETGQLKVECLGYLNDKKWQDLSNCGNKLIAHDPATGKQYVARAKSEQDNEIQSGKLDEAVKQGDLAKARKLLDKIDDDSVYKKAAAASYGALAKQIIDDPRDGLRPKAMRYASAHKCADLDRLIQQATAQGPDAVEAVRGVRCELVAANPNPPPLPKNPPNAAGSGSAVAPPPASCDADALDDKAAQDEAVGQHAAALKSFEAAIRCKPTERRYQKAFMSACNGGDAPKAKFYYKKLANKGSLGQMCVRNGISIPQLEAP